MYFFSVISAIVVLLSSQIIAAEKARVERPNIVFILTDDQPFDTIAAYGGEVLTPHIDSLAQRGVRFDRAYCSTPMCTPSRYTCLTGQYAGRCEGEMFLKRSPIGVISQVTNSSVELRKDQWNIAKYLQSQGYKTGISGKWDLGTWIFGWDVNGKWEYPPGWKELGLQGYSRVSDADDPMTINAMRYNHKIFQKELIDYGFNFADGIYWANLNNLQHDEIQEFHNLEWNTKAALDFIEQSKEDPFFLFFSTTLHHSPNPNKSIESGRSQHMTGAGWIKDPITDVMPLRSSLQQRVTEAGFKASTAFCTWLDDSIGAILQKLDEHNLHENTIIIFMGDNGNYGKTSLYEIGINVPLIISYPDEFAQNVSRDHLVQNIDVVPSILDFCGFEVPEGVVIDGKSLVPLLQKDQFPSFDQWRDSLFVEFGYARGVLTKEWKYIATRFPKHKLDAKKAPTIGSNIGLEKLMTRRNLNYKSPDQLYYLPKEIIQKPFDRLNEQNNLIHDQTHHERIKELRELLKGYLQQFPNRPFGEFISQN